MIQIQICRFREKGFLNPKKKREALEKCTQYIKKKKRVVSSSVAGYEILAFEKHCLHYNKISTES